MGNLQDENRANAGSSGQEKRQNISDKKPVGQNSWPTGFA